MSTQDKWPWWSYQELVDETAKIVLQELLKGSLDSAAHRVVQTLMNVGVEKGRRLERGEKDPN